ncbi:VRR-NUC domain-containing protein [Pseudomonas leptonychotis]|uniref:VRR-NUC domain-containing protein n=1 Tax=Pseudomonas leptonychotis TaxID=2448482 RepID=UPI003866B1B1
MIPTEHDEQKALIKWFDLQYPSLRGRLAACPNGGQRNVIVAAKLKAEGVRPGYPDLNLMTPRHGFAGLIIEMKRIKGGSITPQQADWLQWFSDQGFMAVCCKGFDSAKQTITDYLSKKA